jgi:hypothetical protein
MGIALSTTPEHDMIANHAQDEKGCCHWF